MSRSSFKTPVAPEPLVKVGQVFEYASGHYRSGRFVVQSFQGARYGVVGAIDLWVCKELRGGDERKYTEADLVALSSSTLVQPGQLWETNLKRIARILRPLFGVDDVWKYRIEGDTDESEVFEYTVIGSWTRIVGLSTKVLAAETCPICGARGRQIYTSFDCPNSTCQNYRRP